MTGILNFNVGYGVSVMTGHIVASGSQQSFSYEQKQFDILTIPNGVPNGTPVCVRFRFGAWSKDAAVRYRLNPLQGPWLVAEVLYDTDGATTAALLKPAIEALLSGTPELVVTDNADGTLDLVTDVIGLMAQYSGFVYVSREKVNSTFDLDTYAGMVYLLATCSGGIIRYREHATPTDPTPTVGDQVLDGGTFSIYGKPGIINARFVEDTATAAVDYEIFI